MAITEVKHVWDEADAPNSVLHIAFDRALTEREAAEVAQLVNGVHERHEAARDFAANDPHHRRHLSRRLLAQWAAAGIVGDGAQVVKSFDPERVAVLTGKAVGKPTGFDVTPGSRRLDIEPATGAVVVIEVPEVRTPYWEFEEKAPFFAGTCGDCGRAYVGGVDEPHHYVCPSLPPEGHPFVKMRVTACHEDCAIDCGRNGFGTPVKGV